MIFKIYEYETPLLKHIVAIRHSDESTIKEWRRLKKKYPEKHYIITINKAPSR